MKPSAGPPSSKVLTGSQVSRTLLSPFVAVNPFGAAREACGTIRTGSDHGLIPCALTALRRYAYVWPYRTCPSDQVATLLRKRVGGMSATSISADRLYRAFLWSSLGSARSMKIFRMPEGS